MSAGHHPRPAKPPPRRPRSVEETSAGGLIVDPDSGVPRAALIARRNRTGGLLWALPKGHLEEGESFEQAAVREIAEETGITGRVVRPLGSIDYWFVFDNQRIHKTVYHFLVRATGGELSTDDVEVDEVEWVPLDQVPDRLTYPNERELVNRELVAEDGDLLADLT